MTGTARDLRWAARAAGAFCPLPAVSLPFLLYGTIFLTSWTNPTPLHRELRSVTVFWAVAAGLLLVEIVLATVLARSAPGDGARASARSARVWFCVTLIALTLAAGGVLVILGTEVWLRLAPLHLYYISDSLFHIAMPYAFLFALLPRFAAYLDLARACRSAAATCSDVVAEL